MLYRLLFLFQTLLDIIKHLNGSLWNSSPRTKYIGNTNFKQKFIILWWYHPSTHDKNIWPSKGAEFFDELRNQGFMTSSKCAHTHGMHICIHSLLGHFTGSLKKRTYVHIKTKISKSCSNNFCSSVMSILSHFCHKKTRSATFTFHEFMNPLDSR